MTEQVAERNSHTREEVERNELGVIAESYDILHNISYLGEAKKFCPMPVASHKSAIQSVFQAAELALWNMVRLTDRTTCLIAQGKLPNVLVYMRWIRGFHSILRHLGESPKTIQQRCVSSTKKRTMGINESPALQAYVQSTKELEIHMRCYLTDRGHDTIATTIGKSTHSDALYSILHLIRYIAHEGTKWESDLYSVEVDDDMPEFDRVVATEIIKTAIEKSQIGGETFYTEFVALHQIPEILSYEANDQVEQGIREIRAGNYSKAIEYIAISRSLLSAMVESQRVMCECLATSEYHYFRDNLGPASGMHSLSIRYHMFRDLFKSLWYEIENVMTELAEGNLADTVTYVDQQRNASMRNWLIHSLLNEAFSLYAVFDEWRHEHLHMPRNCLGSGGTKSMIGVPDGLEAVKAMRHVANSLSSLKKLHNARGMSVESLAPNGILTSHHLSEDSLDSIILRATGEATRRYFPHVQDKGLCPFKSSQPVRRP